MTESRNLMNEIFFMRSIACLTIVFLHVLTHVGMEYPDSNFLSNIRMLLMFGTPAFIFISELLISRRYKNDLPNNFITKRIKLILIPYVIMSLFYAGFYGFIEYRFEFIYHLPIKIVNFTFFGGWHGYFILIIFQFYILHILYNKFLNKFKPKTIMFYSFILNAAYLLFFNITTPLNIPYADYIWERYYWMPFIGWLFYFSVAYYCGRNYETFKRWLTKNTILIFSLPLLTATLFLLLHNTSLIDVSSSKRVDVILYATSIIFLLYYLGLKINKVPKFLMMINNYSFGIYLVHYFYVECFKVFFKYVLSVNVTTFVITSFVGSIFLSIITIYILNKFSFGKYLVGNINIVTTRKQPETLKQTS